MSFWVAAAVVGSAVIGAVGSSKSSSKAAKSAERGQDILAASRDEARGDVNRLFPQAQAIQGQAQQDFRDFLTGQVLPQQTQPFQQGNMAAQQQVQRGLSATQAAILGLAPDLSGFQARSFAPPQFNLPQPEQPQQPSGFQLSQQQNQSIQDGLTNLNLGGFSGGGFGGSNRFSNLRFGRSQ